MPTKKSTLTGEAVAKKPVTKPKAKPAPVEKAKPERVSPEKVLEVLAELGMTRSTFAKAAGVSPALLSEWSGHGRRMAPTVERFALAEKAARAFAAKVVAK
jgi:DNA-binding transcriptional regulator YiaG